MSEPLRPTTRRLLAAIQAMRLLGECGPLSIRQVALECQWTWSRAKALLELAESLGLAKREGRKWVKA